jgi:hypothetical protein
MMYRLTAFLLLLSVALHGQMSIGGRPLSESLQLPAVPPLVTPPLDTEAARSDDANHPEWQRFAAPVSLDVSLNTHGVWSTVPGGRVWRCLIESPNGAGMVLPMKNVFIPQGGRLFAFTADGKSTWGAYTEDSNTPDGAFTLGPLPGRAVMLELFEPDGTNGQATLALDRVDIVYDAAAAGVLGFGDARACNININCPEGDDWKDEKRGVARILMIFSNGAGWCSGSLIANTADTPEPFFLTAHHCQLIGMNPSFAQWRFDFHYEAPGCPNPTSEPPRQSVTGCERLAWLEETDFLLLRITPPPASYGLYFNGWTRNSNPPNTGTFVHHPIGDIKKISIDNVAPSNYPFQINWGPVFGISPPNTHWNVVPDAGIFQPGSSGCPLFGPSGRILGQLHGGIMNAFDSCKVQNAFFGRFDLSWEMGATPQSRLRDWLDPINLNIGGQPGYDQPQVTTYAISGAVRNAAGQPMPDVIVRLIGPDILSSTTDAQGNYAFQQVPAGHPYVLKPAYDGTPANGVTTFDMVLYTKHIIDQQPLDSPWKIISGDTNRSNSLTTFDLVEIRRLILGNITQFGNTTSWRFFPANHVFDDPAEPFSGPLPQEFIQINLLQQHINGLDFIGVKTGDANSNALPGN